MNKEHSEVITGIDKALIDQALEWRAAMDNDVIDSDVRASFQAWVMSEPAHMQAYDYAERFWERLGAISEPDSEEGPSLQIRRDVSASRRQSTSTLVISALVIALAGFGAIFAFVNDRSIDTKVASAIAHKTGTAEIRTIVLSDGTEVVLGPKSAVETTLNDEMRLVSLSQGEAYFDVADDSGRAFVVKAGATEITVTGTKFDVRKSKDSTRISVGEGEVQVGIIGEEPSFKVTQTLYSGQAIRESGKQLGSVSLISPTLVGAWRDKRLTFFNEPLTELVAQLNRYDHREIVIGDKGVEGLSISATLNADDIDALLVTLAEIYPLTIYKVGVSQLVIETKK